MKKNDFKIVVYSINSDIAIIIKFNSSCQNNMKPVICCFVLISDSINQFSQSTMPVRKVRFARELGDELPVTRDLIELIHMSDKFLNRKAPRMGPQVCYGE